MKGALVTGNIIDIIEIILILALIMGLLGICGLNLSDIFNIVGSGVSQIWSWFIGF